MINVRVAGRLDARPMAGLLNEIIREGGTTAFTNEVTRDTLLGWFAQAPDQSVWHVAEDPKGALLGFQSIEPKAKLPAAACDIATFVQVGQTGLGIGSKLFEATRKAAVALNYEWINATIRADNSGGLAYYQSRGFEDYARHPNVLLGNGMYVDRISKRYNL
ncbi:GNAT family N-acetyltransferase [Sulfitobacter sp. M368]|uniref:GNAT family N-acetyltransferase n=1 Tax=Sulfitobacter sp. M368 TaxID=2867021 RepID=UPI0021A372C0|nr:GNAT family N-acetyltransferase [Sulfitobacter sp. M368]